MRKKGRGQRRITGQDGRRGTEGTLYERLSGDERRRLEGLSMELRDKARKAMQPPPRTVPSPGRHDPGPGKSAAASQKNGRPQKHLARPAIGVKRKAPVTLLPAPRQPSKVIRVRQFEFWTLKSPHAVFQVPPRAASAEEGSRLAATMDRGRADTGDKKSGRPVSAIIGLDFGTSASKIVVRLVGEGAEDPTFAIETPECCRIDGNPYLWRTMAWVEPDGTINPWPTGGGTPMDRLKTTLMIGRPTETVAVAGASEAPMYLDAAIGYLAALIRYTRGWILERHAAVFRDRPVHWSLNLGLPAATYDDAKLVELYLRVACCARVLADSADPVNVAATRLVLKSDSVRDAARSQKTAGETLGVAVLPEVAAEVAGFARATGRADGLYTMVDVGATTLDICTFILSRRTDGGDRYDMLYAEVRQLGAETQRWFTEEGRPPDGFPLQAEMALRWVIWPTKVWRDPKSSRWRTLGRLPVFLCGGGARATPFEAVVQRLGPWLQTHVRNRGIEIVPLDLPANLDAKVANGDFDRLAVAWGLSLPPFEIGELKRPSEIDNVDPAPFKDLTSRFVSKDQM